MTARTECRDEVATAPRLGHDPVSVVIPCHSLNRFDQLARAVAAVGAQTPRPAEIIVVVDHNPGLYRRATRELAGVTVLRNEFAPGVSGNRNTGVLHAGSPVVALLDDDALPHPGWLAALLAPFADPTVIGTGGAIEPVWHAPRPAWFPEEFLWTVGGTPVTGAGVTPTRNVWSASMAVRREVFLAGGGFRVGFGKVGDAPAPEDTELCLRLSRHSGGQWRRVEAAVVDHPVPVARTAFGFFLRRCYQEGRGKVRMARLLARAPLAAAAPGGAAVLGGAVASGGAASGGVTAPSLSAERDYLTRTLPKAVARGVRDAALGRGAAHLARAGAVLAGVAAAAFGGAVESVHPVREVAA